MNKWNKRKQEMEIEGVTFKPEITKSNFIMKIFYIDPSSRDNSINEEVFGERLYRDAFHIKQKHKRLLKDYLNTSWTFRPKINKENIPRKKHK